MKLNELAIHQLSSSIALTISRGINKISTNKYSIK